MSPMWKIESTFSDATSSVMASITERDPGYKQVPPSAKTIFATKKKKKVSKTMPQALTRTECDQLFLTLFGLDLSFAFRPTD